MRRKILPAALPLALLALALAGCGGGPEPPAVLDDFQSYTADAGLPSPPWTGENYSGGNMIAKADSVSGSQAAYKGTGYYYGYHNGTNAVNCQVIARVRWGGSDNGAVFGIIARRTGPAAYYRLSLAVNDGTVYLMRLSGTSEQQLDYEVLPVAFVYTAYHELKLVVNGTSIKGYLDGTEIVSAVDGEITGSGYAGIAVSHGDAYLDDFDQIIL